ncbi:nucleotide exchange factor GrpE [Parasphaerochaeta coccoides]|uniref:Protein GrpE n=1 Tax=Parasphaerochaeta coccoides (strain ATCC BAA-1237 / DSM 17374 / SPN1) TaxID=760011 RepID=F4GKJ4_PARC1|nr:nucleotide exchange factor GrpE [Parasphaerochaeta coccoides]AEC02877.1 Protein grpE [Parasphaerochaeta coccoides DSM 17374]
MSKGGKSAGDAKPRVRKDDGVTEEIAGKEFQAGEEESPTVQETDEALVEDRTAELEAKVVELTKALEEVKDKALRREAEIDNYRKRLIRDKEEAVTYANTRLLGDLIPVLDDLERAISAAETATDVQGIRDGIVLVEQRFRGILMKDWGLEEIEAEGQDFDPNLHEAYLMTESEDCPVEKVAQVFSKGYKMHDRIIRPAKVKVIKPKV